MLLQIVRRHVASGAVYAGVLDSAQFDLAPNAQVNSKLDCGVDRCVAWHYLDSRKHHDLGVYSDRRAQLAR